MEPFTKHLSSASQEGLIAAKVKFIRRRIWSYLWVSILLAIPFKNTLGGYIFTCLGIWVGFMLLGYLFIFIQHNMEQLKPSLDADFNFSPLSIQGIH